MAFTPIDEEEIIDEPVAEETKPRFIPIEDDEFFGIGGEEETQEQAVEPEVAEVAVPIEAPKSRFTPIEEEEFFGIPQQEEPIPVTGEEGFLRQAADVPLKIGESINNSLKGLADLFGADNAVSQNLTQNADWYRSLLSAQALEDEQEVGRILQEAENEGLLGQLGAGLEAFSVAPVDFVASGLGSLAVFAAGGVAGRAAGLGAKGIQAVQAGLSAGMGAGIAKGEIYQSVKDEMLAQGKTEEEAKRVAMEAQSFGGKNLDQILIAAGLGTIDAYTGAEKIIGKVLAKGGLKPDVSRVASIIKNGITEGAPEFIQAAQEKFASNLALQREGVNVPLTQGVFSQGALEGLVGVGLGAGVAAIEPRIQTPPTKEEISAAAAETQDVARRSTDVAPATAAIVENQANEIMVAATVGPLARREGETDTEYRARIEASIETPEQRVARLQREAQEAAGDIELEEEAGLPPQPVTPTPEAPPVEPVAPVEPVVPAEGAVEPTVAEVAPETVVAAEQKAAQDFDQDTYGQEPYINHLRRVSEQMPNEKLKAAAFLHDSVEDGKMTLDDVRSQFGDDVAGLVDVVSRKEGETYAQFIDRVAQNPEAAQIKLADLRENIRNVEDFKPSLRSRYEKAIAVLEPVVAQATAPEAAPVTPEAAVAPTPTEETIVYRPAGKDDPVATLAERLVSGERDFSFQVGGVVDAYGLRQNPRLIVEDVGRGGVIVYTPEKSETGRKKAEEIRALNEQYKDVPSLRYEAEYHRSLGKILEYSPKDIESFITQRLKEIAPELAPTIPQLEPLRRVARAEQTEEDVAGLVDAGFAEVYKGQPVLTQAGLDALPEAERPRLTPEARKIQIDTGANEVAAEAISKNLRIGVDQIDPNVRIPAGWTLEGDVYVPPTVEAAPEVVAPEAVAPEKQVVPQEQEQVAPVVRVDQEQVNQGKPDIAKIVNQFTVLERAAVAGKLLEEGYIDGKTADRFVKEATNERTGGFSMAQIGDAQASADEKFNQQIAAARASQPVAGEVSPAAVDLEAEDAKKANQERKSPALALKPKTIIGMTAREALSYLSGLNLVERRDWDAEGGIANWRKDPNIPKPFYAQIQDAASILSKLPLKILDADKIVSNAERGFKGGAKRFGNGDIGIPLTETARVQTASGSWVRRSVEKPLNVATLVHEVGHTLTADAVNRYITSKNPKGSEYLKVLDGALKVKSTPQPIKDLIVLYKTTISQLGLEKEYFGKKGLAGGRARDSQRKAFDRKIVNKLTGNPFTWSQYYGLANIDEFVAQAWSSQSFQDLLKQIKAPDQQSLWTKFTRIIRDLFGFPSDSMASAVIDISMQIAELETPIGARKGVAFSGVTVADRIAGRGEEPAPPVTNIWKAPEQEITSQETSINEKKIPAVFNQVKEWKEGTVNADIGGGRFDNVTNWLRDRGVENLIIDWFNRDRAFNEANINRVRGGQADTATISNVLNVIQEPDARELVIRQAADAIKEDGTAYFYIYEGNGSGQGRATTKGWQENRKTASYVDEISQHFENVERRNQMIVATGPIKEIGFVEAEPEMPLAGIPTFTEGTPEAATLKEMEASMAKVDAASEAKGGKPETYKISEIASVWMDSGLGERELQDAIVEYTNLTPANAVRVAKAINKQYGIQQRLAEARTQTAEGISVEAIPEGATIPEEADPKRPKTTLQRVIDAITGVRVPPVKITANEKTLLKEQIKLKAAATREAKKAQQEMAADVVEAIKAMDIRGGLRPKQVSALMKRAALINFASEKSVDRFTNYAEKVIANANYDRDLSEAKLAQKRAKELAKSKRVPSNQQDVLNGIADIEVGFLDDPREFAEAANHYMRAFKSVVSEDYVVVPDDEMTSYLSAKEDEAGASRSDFDLESITALAEKYGVSVSDVNNIINAQDTEAALAQYANREVFEGLLSEKAKQSLSALKKYDTSGMTQSQQAMVAKAIDLDVEAIEQQEKIDLVRRIDNILVNGRTNGFQKYVDIAEAQSNARKAARDGTFTDQMAAWINILTGKAIGRDITLVGKKQQKELALTMQSVADTFRNIFGKKQLGKAQRIIGHFDLIKATTAANNDVDAAGEQMEKFYNGQYKKYGKALSAPETIMAEGIAGYLIQSVPFKSEGDSIAQRRRLIQEDIRARREDGDVEMAESADMIEEQLAKVDGDSVQEILNNLKSSHPAAYESLIWMKDTLLPQYKDFLKAHDENYNDQTNNYENPNYLPIKYKFVGAIDLMEDSGKYARLDSLTPKQAANTIKRVDYTVLPKRMGTTAQIDYSIRKNVFNSLAEQLRKAHTSSAWTKIDAFLKSKDAPAVFGGKVNVNFMADRLKLLKDSQERRSYEWRGDAKFFDALATISRKFGIGYALGGIYQPFKQVPDQLMTTVANTGRTDLLSSNFGVILFQPKTSGAMNMLSKFSIGRRGDAAMGGTKFVNEVESNYTNLERYFNGGNWAKFKERAQKLNDIWLYALKKSDYTAAAASWMTYYQAKLAQDGIKFTDWNQEAQLVETDTARQEAAAYAESMTDIYQGSSDPTNMATFAQRGKSGYENIFKAIFMPLNSFALQQRSRIMSDGRDAMTKSTDPERMAQGRYGLAATLGGMVLFHATRRFFLPVVSGLGAASIYALLGIDPEEPDEEKKEEMAKFRWRQFTSELAANMFVGGFGSLPEAPFIDALNRAAYFGAEQVDSETLYNDKGEKMSYSAWTRNNSPFWRYKEYGSGMNLGMLDITSGQIGEVADVTRKLLDPERYDTLTEDEKRLIYFAALSEWLYTLRLNDTDMNRMIRNMAKETEMMAKEREAELKRIREGR